MSVAERLPSSCQPNLSIRNRDIRGRNPAWANPLETLNAHHPDHRSPTPKTALTIPDAAVTHRVMAAAGEKSTRIDSSAGRVSSPPPGASSATGSPTRQTKRRSKPAAHTHDSDMDEIVVGSDKQSQSSQTLYQPLPQTASGSQSAGRAQAPKRFTMVDGEWVQLTAAGVPRKKPGRKPGTTMKPKQPAGPAAAEAPEQTKNRKPRKSRDTSTPPIQRKRKLASASDVDTDVQSPRPLAPAAGSGAPSPSPSLQPPHQPPPQPHVAESFSPFRPQPPSQSQPEQRFSPKIPKREGYPSSMKSILNTDDGPDPPTSSSAKNIHSNTSSNSAIPVRTSGQAYDPIRGNYDPVRETMTPHSHNPFSSTSGSPRALPQAQPLHRSPSIASMIEPNPTVKTSPSHPPHAFPIPTSQSRLRAPEVSAPPPASPSYAPKPTLASQLPLKPPPPEPRREAPGQMLQAPRPTANPANFTTIANGPIKKVSPKQKPTTGISTPRTDNLEEAPHENDERSILDFGKARPGEEREAPTIVLSIPITLGETNKYVNFMRMAEDQYGWDALHPRLAANRDRKARIAAAAASLEKAESGRESGDEMSVDLSDGDASNIDNGGASGVDVTVKPKKKRNFKEDQYDVDDDFVDDSEMLWEAQAAASRDGFFVYSGPLVPEEEKPPAGHEGPPKRGRGGRGSRGGGRGGARGAGGTGRGGGPGSRGGAVTRKPRITKSEKAQREREKAERENLAKSAAGGFSLQPPTPSFSVQELGA